jgi:hypothetical protein
MESLNELIACAQSLLDTGFSPQDFQMWQQLAFVTILGLLGPLHYYTQNFSRFTSEPSPRSLLTGEGLLEAVRAVVCNGRCERGPNGKLEPAASPAEYTPWISRPKKWRRLETDPERHL